VKDVAEARESRTDITNGTLYSVEEDVFKSDGLIEPKSCKKGYNIIRETRTRQPPGEPDMRGVVDE
jgi:hypothetical protein